MCIYNISLKDELVTQARQSFASESAMTLWLQQQMEALLVSFNASQQAARQKARQAIEAMRRQSEQNGNEAMTLDDINNEIRQAREAYMVTGNLRHFPKTPIVVTPAQMMKIVEGCE